MMYFLVSMPPKMSCIVRPAFSATSVKLASGLAGAVVRDFACSAWHRTTRNAKIEAWRTLCRAPRKRERQENFTSLTWNLIANDISSDNMRDLRMLARFLAVLTEEPVLPPPQREYRRLRSRTNIVPLALPFLPRKLHSEPARLSPTPFPV